MNLLALVENITGAAFEFQSKKGMEYAGPCPFCGGDDRFRVWLEGSRDPKQHFWCRQCGTKGGSVLLLMKVNGYSAFEAKKELVSLGFDEKELNETAPVKQTILPPTKADFGELAIDLSQVEQWHTQGRNQAIEYYSQWGLTPQDVDAWMLGYGTYKGTGYVIPHWWIEGQQWLLKGVKFRHITDDKKRRFSAVEGSAFGGVFGMQHVSNPDGTREGPLLDYLMIVEAEKDAILLNGMGFPTIAYSPDKQWDHYLGYVLHNIVQPIIIYDNDGKAGALRAAHITRQLRTRPLLGTTDSFSQKSPSDVAKEYDKDVLKLWLMETFKVDPT